MNRGNPSRGPRGVSTNTRGSSFRGRGRGASRGGSSNSTPEPTTENAFDAERTANAAKREYRGQRGGGLSSKGGQEARGAFKNKSVRFSDPLAQQNVPLQQPFIIPKKPGAAPPKRKLSHAVSNTASDPNAHTAKIKSTLQQNGLATYPNWPMAQPGNPAGKATIKDYWNMTKEYRAKVRNVLMSKGLIDDPDKPKKLSEAIDFKGTCEEMCPRFEQITRIMERDVKTLEKTLAIDGTLWPDPNKMVKAYGRSSAGQDAPLPSDIRTPAALKRTLDYLIQDVLGETNDLSSVHNFLWDRTRSIRRDFTFQQASLTEVDYLDEVYCLETIARFHVVALHQMSDPSNTSEDFSEHQEIEQLGRTLLSLIHTYEDCEAQGIKCDNEAEFRAYFVIYHARNPAMLEAVHDWGRTYWESDEIQTATSLVECLHNIWEIHGPLRPHSASDVTLNMYNRFFDIIRQPEVSYTMACFAEIHFNSVRKTALLTILSSYRKQRDQTIDWTLPALNSYLHFDSPFDVEHFVETHGLSITDGNGAVYLNFDSGTSLMEPEVKIKQPHSKKLVEIKRGDMSLPSSIYSNSYATNDGFVTDNGDGSMFVDGDDISTFPQPSWEGQQPKAEASFSHESSTLATNAAPKLGSVSMKTVGGFIDTDDDSPTDPLPTNVNPSAIFGTVPATQQHFQNPLKGAGSGPIFFGQQTPTTANQLKPTFAGLQASPVQASFASASSSFVQPQHKTTAGSFFPIPQIQGLGSTTPAVAPQTIPSIPSSTSKQRSDPPTKPSLFAGLGFATQGTDSKEKPTLFPPSNVSSQSELTLAATDAYTSFGQPTAESPAEQLGMTSKANIFVPATINGDSQHGNAYMTKTFTSFTNSEAPPSSSLFSGTKSNTPLGALATTCAEDAIPKVSSVLALENSPVIIGKQHSGNEYREQQLGTASFSSLGNSVFSGVAQLESQSRPEKEPKVYNWLEPFTAPNMAKDVPASPKPAVETSVKEPTHQKAQTPKFPTSSIPSDKTIASNLAPFLANWAAVGDGGIIDQFMVKEVQKACQEAYDKHYEEVDARNKAALREADNFRVYSLRVKFFYRWRVNAQKLWQLKRGKRARELRKQMAEERYKQAAEKDVIKEFRSSVMEMKGHKRKSKEEDLLAATGILDGVHDVGAKIRKIVHGDMATPQQEKSTTPAGSPGGIRFGHTNTSLGHSTASLQSLVDGDHVRNITPERRNHGSSLGHRRSHSEIIRKEIPLNISQGGSRIHLFPDNWNLKDDRRPKPNNVQTDYFRLKARGIHTLPNGTPLASTAAVHLRSSLVDSAKHSIYRNSLSNSSQTHTPERTLKRSVSKLSMSAPAKKARASPVHPPKPGHKQEMEEIKERARRIMNDEAVKKRRDEDLRRSSDWENNKVEEMEDLFRRSRKLKEDMAKGEEWFRRYNESWSRSGSKNSESAQPTVLPSASASMSAMESAYKTPAPTAATVARPSVGKSSNAPTKAYAPKAAEQLEIIDLSD